MTILEDRGLLGVEGRRLYRIQLKSDPDNVREFEVQEVELEPAT